MRAELVSLNPRTVPFLSRAVVNLSWYDCSSTWNVKPTADGGHWTRM